MDELYVLQNVDELKAISHHIRIAILLLLTQEAMTNKQLADSLGEDPARLHFHVKELVSSGLVRLVEERPKGGVLEKYYRARAMYFDASGVIPKHPVEANKFGMTAWDAGRKLYFLAKQQGMAPSGSMRLMHYKLKPERAEEIRCMLKRFSEIASTPDADGTDYVMMVSFHQQPIIQNNGNKQNNE